MRGFLTLCFWCGLTLLMQDAAAATLSLDASETVAPMAEAVGRGLCGAVTKFNNPPSPLATAAEAIALLNKPDGDASIAARVTRIFSSKMDFSVGTGSEGDFFRAGDPGAAFPYCQDPRAMPTGADNDNIALRLRGYLNISQEMAGLTRTMALRCDDGCALWLGRSRQLVLEANIADAQLTGRRTRWVIFAAAGKYPVELVYYQNSSGGSVEWSTSRLPLGAEDGAVADGQWDLLGPYFTVVGESDLYASFSSTSASCQQCGAPGQDCPSSSYCGDGLCHLCDSAAHCGPSCVACPADRQQCRAGACVQCASHFDCPSENCDRAAGICLPPRPCNGDAECGDYQVCKDQGTCGELQPSCEDSFCSNGMACVARRYGQGERVCVEVPASCTNELECPNEFACDVQRQTCVHQLTYWTDAVGKSGCSALTPSRRGDSLLGPLGIVCLLLLGLRRGKRSSPS